MNSLDLIIERIEKARLRVNAHHIVHLVGVSKYSSSEDIKKLYDYGQRAFGENKVQDLESKINALKDLPIAWHFIGNLQKNKINKLIELNPYLMQSLSSYELAIELDKRLKIKNSTMDCLLQINSANDDRKGGVSPEMARDIYTQIQEECSNISMQGIMSIGAHSNNKDEIKKSFEKSYNIFNNLPNATICSMGMSSDFELAIECGSNMVRLGSILFK